MNTKTSKSRRTSYTPEQRKEQASALHDKLTSAVAALASSDEWKRYLDFTTSFHNYSFSNLMLILAQMPEATQVAGFRQWQAKGRQVRKGEKSIKIFGFSTKKTTDEATGEETSRKYFPTLSVFDVSQTDQIEGMEVSDLAPRLDGDDTLGVVAKVDAYLTGLGWTFEREPVRGGRNGYTTADGSKRVVVGSDLSDAHAAKTALHEAAHITLGHIEAGMDQYALHRGSMECEAESVAYVVAGMLGLDTASYSVSYVTGWTGGDVKVLHSTAQAVLRAVHVLAEVLAPQAAETALVVAS